VGRDVSTDLQNLLDLPSCKTQTTLDLILTDTTQIHVATEALTDVDSIGADIDYADDLRRTNDLKQSVFAPPNRVTASIQNVDKAFGIDHITAESLIKAEAIVGRYFVDESGVLPSVWVELFRGEARPTQLTETAVEIEVLNDLSASGYCVGDWTLAENCQFIYKHAGTCGSASVRATCNKKRRSKAGCSGDDNEHHFGGMEFPDVQTPSVPTGGDPEPPDPPTCPRTDQYVLIEGPDGNAIATLAEHVTQDTLLFNPVKGTFHRIRSVRIVRDQPIWMILAEGGIECFSSRTHRIIGSSDDASGSRIDLLGRGDDVLTYSTNLLMRTKAIAVHEAGEIDDVVMIEMEDGHIYCAGDDGKRFVVCHNAKPIDR